jgi:hypothetical protein
VDTTEDARRLRDIAPSAEACSMTASGTKKVGIKLNG